mmetsp:Transcript_22620/g.44816  ORF Transcript_22620/g.44816 Transcript_22620/m.44816 type:complete len:1178 (+) Transcript_22620:87-3620(+)
MSTLPVEAVQHVEDFGHILLQAQKDLERVRTRLETLPLGRDLKNTQGQKMAAPMDGDIYSSLSEVLNRTESNLRTKAEVVLRSVDDCKINTLPTLQAPGELPFQQMNSTAIPTRQQHPATFGSQTMTRSGSEKTLKRLQQQQQYVRRSALERMNEQKAVQMLSQPQGPAGRAFLQQKYGLANSPVQYMDDGSSNRPVNKYGYKQGAMLKGLNAPQAAVLPKMYRKDPKLFPRIMPEDTQQGVYNLVNRGMIPTFVDVGPAFHAEPGPFKAEAAQFHNFYDQFEKTNTQVATHTFNLANVQLDLADTLLAEEDQEEKSLTEAPPVLGGPPEPQEPAHIVVVRPTVYDPEDGVPVDPSFGPQELAQATSDGMLALTDESGPERIRDYDELLDTYSLHQFIIRKGKTLSTTPEFLSYQRKYSFLWGQIKSIIQKLEAFLTQYQIPLAYVNGQKVVELAEEMVDPTVPQLLECLENIDKAALMRQIPGHRYTGPDREELAATKMQSFFRMVQGKRGFREHKLKDACARVIQKGWYRYQTLQETRHRIASVWEKKLQAWRKGWNIFKANWNNIQKKKRVVVHIASLSFQPYQRKNVHNNNIRQNQQLTRLCEAADPDVDIIYITPFDLNPEIQQYYMKLLEVGGVNDVSSRIKIMTPENYDRLPEHFSLAKLVLYSPRLLKRIRQAIRGRPAYIVPCELGPEDLQLAVHLNLPILSPEPDVAALFGSKSGSKRIFAAAEVPSPPGAHDIFDEDDFYSFFAKLIVDHLDCARWLFKIDNEYGGRGIAYFDTAQVKIISIVRREKQNHSVRWKLPEIISAAQNRIARGLREFLPTKATLAVPSAWDNKWENYAQAYFRWGGVIEACPAYTIGSPSVNIFIEPDGTVTVPSSHDQLFSSPYVFCGATFPSTGPCDMLHNMAIAIGRACFKEGIIGHAGVDFVMYFDSAADCHRLWVVDLNLRMTQTQASFMLFDFLMKGKYIVYNKPRQHNRSSIPFHLRPDSVGDDYNDDPNRIRYLITPDEEGDESRANSSLGGSSVMDEEYNDTSRNERTYSVINYLYQPNLATVQFGSFFNMCRLKGVSFDLRSKKGTAFVMMDSLASGTLGLLCVAAPNSPLQARGTALGSAGGRGSGVVEALKAIVNALSFLNEQVGLLRLSNHVYADESNLQASINCTKAVLKAKLAS